MSQSKFFEYVNRLLKNERHNRSDWARELSVTERTITNFNKRLEREYDVVIDYHPGEYGYYELNREESANFNDFVNFIQNLNTSERISETFMNSEEVGRHLIFHQNWNQIDWMQFFNPLLSAINEQRAISFEYFNYRTERREQLKFFRPYWMKQNAYFRWYLIGFVTDDAAFPIVIGCDKIRKLTIEESTFVRKPEHEHFRQAYENVFGVYAYQERQAETVRIECTRFQASYIQSLPLHPTQAIESQTNETVIFRFKLVINHEFAYELLRQNVWNFNPAILDAPHPQRTAIKVLDPAWLADYFRQTYKRAYLAYCDNTDVGEKLLTEVKVAPFPYPLPEF